MARPGGRRRAGRAPATVTYLVAALLGAACEGDPGDPMAPLPPLPAPRIAVAEVTGGPTNVLSAVVTARTRFTDSVVVRYGTAGAPADSVTRAARPYGDSVTVPVLGLLPDTVYELRMVAYGVRDSVVTAILTHRTGALPPDLPTYVATGPDPSPGFVVFSAGDYALVIDNTGRVVWYRRFAYGAGLAFTAQPTGRYVARPGTPEPTDLHPWVELDPLGTVTRTLACARGLESRLHDFIAEPDGSYWIMCDDVRRMDLSAMDGVSDAQVTATAIQHVGANGQLLFSWTPFDHFDIADLPVAARSGTSVNWTHGNALDLDMEGDVVVSFRNLSEITKIDVATGMVAWRLGGLRNQFTFPGAGASFARQHGLRLTKPGELLLLDNLGDPLDSRVERYAVDPDARVVSLVTSHGADPPVTAQLGGSVQALPNGRTLVSFGTAGRVEEHDATGRVVWRIEGPSGYVFRVQRIRSLYAPGVGSSR